VGVLEVCGFNDWLIRMLKVYRCERVVLIQPDERKTDRRDAAALSELLWANRGRLLHGKPVRGLRQVEIADPAGQENRRLTTSAGPDHQGGQRHGEVAVGPTGPQGPAPGRPLAGLVQAGQSAARADRGLGGGDARAGDRHLAHAE
jgi:hypothetical protein